MEKSNFNNNERLRNDHPRRVVTTSCTWPTSGHIFPTISLAESKGQISHSIFKLFKLEKCCQLKFLNTKFFKMFYCLPCDGWDHGWKRLFSVGVGNDEIDPEVTEDLGEEATSFSDYQSNSGTVRHSGNANLQKRNFIVVACILHDMLHRKLINGSM